MTVREARRRCGWDNRESSGRATGPTSYGARPTASETLLVLLLVRALSFWLRGRCITPKLSGRVAGAKRRQDRRLECLVGLNTAEMPL